MNDRQTSYSWVDLPSDLLLSIADRLDITTFIRLSAVCISWASTIRLCLPSFPPICDNKSIPWLLCFVRNCTNSNCSVLTFYDLSTAAYFSVQIPIPLLCEHQLLSTYKDWLVTLDRQLQLHLIKPLTGAHILLPSKGIENEHPKKIILWHNPNDANDLRTFILTQRGRVAFVKLGDESWSSMVNYGSYTDIIVYQGKLYGVSMHLYSYWDLQGSCPERMVVHTEQCSPSGWTKYLLECNGELVMLMINKEENVNLENHTPMKIKLYKLHIFSFNHISSLGDNALFFSASCFYVVSSSGRNDIQGNCVYFTNQISRCFHHAEITFHPNHNFARFDLEKQIYYKPCFPRDSPMHLPPPIWFWPCTNYEDLNYK